MCTDLLFMLCIKKIIITKKQTLIIINEKVLIINGNENDLIAM